MTKDVNATEFPNGIKLQTFTDQRSGDNVTWGVEQNRDGVTAMYMQFSDPQTGATKGFATLDYGPRSTGATFKGITFHTPGQVTDEYFVSAGRTAWSSDMLEEKPYKNPQEVADLASNILNNNNIKDPGVSDKGTTPRPAAKDPQSIATPPPAAPQ